MADQSGPRNPNWRGGRITDPRGYVLIKQPDHPFADVRGYVYEHRLVAEAHLGRYLLPAEEVHHVDEHPSNNRWSNLKVTAGRAEHAVEHRSSTLHSRAVRLPGEPNVRVECACGCGTIFPKYDSVNRLRSFVSGHNLRRVNG